MRCSLCGFLADNYCDVCKKWYCDRCDGFHNIIKKQHALKIQKVIL